MDNKFQIKLNHKSSGLFVKKETLVCFAQGAPQLKVIGLSGGYVNTRSFV